MRLRVKFNGGRGEKVKKSELNIVAKKLVKGCGKQS